MKNKYQRLTKSERRQAIQDYCNEPGKKDLYRRFKRIKIISIVGIVYSVLSFAFDLFYESSIWNFIVDAILLIFCTFFLIKSQDILAHDINAYLIHQKK